MDECAARLQSLVDQYKPIEHQSFAIEKFRDLIVTFIFCNIKGCKDLGVRKFKCMAKNQLLPFFIFENYKINIIVTWDGSRKCRCL